MKQYNSQIKDLAVAAIKQAKEQLDAKFPDDPLFAFSLCTDDDLCTLYHAACTQLWVKGNSIDYDDIGYIYVEWEQSASDLLFNASSEFIRGHYDEHSNDYANQRDIRFESLVQALVECRKEKLFDENTLLCVGSTDPSDHLEKLAMDAVVELNNKDVSDKFTKAFGYEKHRNN